jgi:hypothetical protein
MVKFELMVMGIQQLKSIFSIELMNLNISGLGADAVSWGLLHSCNIIVIKYVTGSHVL